jgi:hypothetical protein
MDYIEDITGADHLEPEWGERFRSWYVMRIFDRKENITIPGELTYSLNVFNFQYRFIIPAKVEFSKGIDDGKIVYGIISYSEAERLLGIFRFPLESNGFFASPISTVKTAEIIKNFSDEELRELIKSKKVLTFEAFRIPYFGFQFFYITNEEFEAMEKYAGKIFTDSFRSSYDKELSSQVEEVKSKLSLLPNYLLILQNVLDLRWKDEKEILTMTNGIIHFGA